MSVVAVLEDDCFAPDFKLDGILPAQAGLHCEHLHYSSAPLRLAQLNAQLLLVLPSKDSSRAIALFHWLRDHPMPMPALAAVTEEYDDPLFELATDVADDFFFWPPHGDELEHRVLRLLGARDDQIQSVRDQLRMELGLRQLVGNDPPFAEVVEKIPAIAASDAPVLISGETGTGKELCVRAIHDLGTRANFPFVPVECGTIAEHLAENEFFGHARGAFTDAHSDQKGLVAMAEGGTLFLDEIDALSLAVQAKLLRLIEEGRYRPLGSDRFSWANIRVEAATNSDLDLSVRQNRFRSDLYFRLNVFRLHLPPLRERRGDIGLLARHFLDRLSRTAGKQPKSLSPGALRMLEHYDWPGNVRELRNVVHRAFSTCPGPQILPNYILLPVRVDPGLRSAEFRDAKALVIETFEREYIKKLLCRNHGNVARAAAEAGKDRRSLRRLMSKHNISRSQFFLRAGQFERERSLHEAS
jgi:DNA-binding NtrC family response regulator